MSLEWEINTATAVVNSLDKKHFLRVKRVYLVNTFNQVKRLLPGNNILQGK